MWQEGARPVLGMVLDGSATPPRSASPTLSRTRLRPAIMLQPIVQQLPCHSRRDKERCEDHTSNCSRLSTQDAGSTIESLEMGAFGALREVRAERRAMKGPSTVLRYRSEAECRAQTLPKTLYRFKILSGSSPRSSSPRGCSLPPSCMIMQAACLHDGELKSCGRARKPKPSRARVTLALNTSLPISLLAFLAVRADWYAIHCSPSSSKDNDLLRCLQVLSHRKQHRHCREVIAANHLPTCSSISITCHPIPGFDSIYLPLAPEPHLAPPWHSSRKESLRHSSHEHALARPTSEIPSGSSSASWLRRC